MSGTGSNLLSPGVLVTIIDESFYGSSGPGTIPLIVIATAANKTAPSGTGIAPYTTPATAGQLFVATSQLELTANFGTPYFGSYQGTILQGNETNEWGLLAAYSYLGISNRAYIIRADIDLSQLNAEAIAPTSPPNTGQYWFNLKTTSFGVFVANGNANPGVAWNPVTVTIPTINQVDSNDVPLASFGTVGQYAIVPWVTSNLLYVLGTPYGASSASWIQVGTADWMSLYPTQILGSSSPQTFPTGGTIIVNGTTITVNSGLGGSTASVTDVITAINAASITNVVASSANNALLIMNTAGGMLAISDPSGIFAALGITVPSNGTLTYPGVAFYQTATSDPTYPSGIAAGSVWIKGNSSRGGANWVIEYYDGTQWDILSAPFYQFNSALSDGTASKDTAASAALGTPSVGSVYIGFDPNTGIQQPRRWNGTYWAALSYIASLTAPTNPPLAGTLWYDLSSSFAADIMVSTGNQWFGYRHYYPQTDPNGVLLSASAPTNQSTGAALVANDLWIDTSNQENYPVLYRWNDVTLRWVLVDKTDQTSPNGIIFNDARSNSGVSFTGIPNSGSYAFNSTNPADLVLSDYVDPDCPNPELYPAGLLLFNQRASNNNVKIWYPTYFQPGSEPTNFSQDDDYTVNSYTVGNIDYVFPPVSNPGTWVNAAGNDSANNNLPFMGRKAQRQMVVIAMRALLTANQDIRSELIYYNLIACPGYCELIDDMSTLNTDQNQVSFVVGDVPSRLTPDSNSLLGWANNTANVAYTSEDGLAPGSYSGTAGDFIGLWYPWGLGTDLSGDEVMIPSSMIALNTIAYNDQVAYQWFAPAGFTRGLVSNASSVGYLDADTETFVPVILNQGQRDILYQARPTGCQINPIAYIPGRGLVVYGQKTLSGNSSALDRINVARLCNYLKYQLDIIVKPFLFEQNDSITQAAAAKLVSNFLNGLINLRAISDYAVKCDSDNNTPERIDQNQLWIDIAVVPIAVVEFIYIPVRILNPGTTSITL